VRADPGVAGGAFPDRAVVMLPEVEVAAGGPIARRPVAVGTFEMSLSPPSLGGRGFVEGIFGIRRPPHPLKLGRARRLGVLDRLRQECRLLRAATKPALSTPARRVAHRAVEGALAHSLADVELATEALVNSIPSSDFRSSATFI
jgi:hypothetical protein